MEFQVTSREFNRNSAKIREESLHKPVIITVRGEPTNVLLSYKEYVRVFKSSDNRKTATELFAHKKAAYCDLESVVVRNKVISLMELEVGILRISRRDTRQGIVLREWFDMEIKPNYEGRVLDITPDIAYTCARLNVPDPRPYQDAWIAATALVHGMTVVTRNVRDFVPMNVSLLCPFTQPH